jgi:peptidoglycan/LPS O-acetylase OafA/YrhL
MSRYEATPAPTQQEIAPYSAASAAVAHPASERLDLALSVEASGGRQALASAHVESLDGLRGLAILLVMVDHFFFGAKSANRALSVLIDLTKFGWLGVDLFFVLSGFLITGILDDAKRSPQFFRNFYARRALRIFPLYYAYLLFFFFVGVRLMPLERERLDEVVRDQWWLWAYATNILIAIKGKFIFASLNHFWSLSVEEHFYLVWPWLVRALTRKTMMSVCIVTVFGAVAARAIIVLGGFHSVGAYVLTPCRMDSLALGGFLALALRNGERHWRGRGWLIATATTFVLLAVGLDLRERSAAAWLAFDVIGYSVAAVFFGLLLLGAVSPDRNSIVRRTFEVGWLRSMGKYAYGLYVISHPLNIALTHSLPIDRLAHQLHSTAAAYVARALLSFTLSCLLALASYHLFEKHFLKLKTFFVYFRRRELA